MIVWLSDVRLRRRDRPARRVGRARDSCGHLGGCRRPRRRARPELNLSTSHLFVQIRAAQRSGQNQANGNRNPKPRPFHDIKAKMALDDSVKARAIDVTTTGSTVTLTGTVRSASERDRAVALARETAGVTAVVDRLEIGR